MSKEYVILNCRDDFSIKRGMFLFLAQDYKGYTTKFDKAGRYNLETVKKDYELQFSSGGLKVIETEKELRNLGYDLRTKSKRKKYTYGDFLVKESLLKFVFIEKTIIDFR